MNLTPDILLGLLAAVVVGAGLISIVGALQRTAARRSYSGDGGDGGPMIGGGHDARQDHHGPHDGHGHGGDGGGGGDSGGGDGGGGGGD